MVLVRTLVRLSFIVTIVAIASGCATGERLSGRDLNSLFDDACKPVKELTSVEGSVWIRVKNIEKPAESGQFPADVRVAQNGELILQVTNLVGGKEAEIRVSKDHVLVNGKPPTDDGSGPAWGGIPLRFAPELFLGRVPCVPQAGRSNMNLALEQDRRLLVTHAGESYTYTFKKQGERMFASHLNWQAASRSIEFRFEDIESETGAARKWEAKGPAGEVKVKWRERKSQ